MNAVTDANTGRARSAVISEIVERHHGDAAFLSQRRQRAVRSADWSLADLADFDERLEALIDGVRIAGESGWAICERDVELGSGELFIAAVLAIESGDRTRISRVLRESTKKSAAADAVLDAFEYVAPRFLQGIVRDLLASASPLGRQIGLAACVRHRVAPGDILARLLHDPAEGVREWAVRACGELGAVEHASRFRTSRDAQGWWEVRSAVLLGLRGVWLDRIMRIAVEPGSHRMDAFRLSLQVGDRRSLELLRSSANGPAGLRWQLVASGIVGDTSTIPWLIHEMKAERAARLAGQAFSLITGVDLLQHRLDRPRPKDFSAGPNDDPQDPDVAVDADDGLPWPDPERVEAWWLENRGRFKAGRRYFMGGPITREHCIEVLNKGYQSQRILAAYHLCLLEPGTPLFNTAAPAWRQQRLLAGIK